MSLKEGMRLGQYEILGPLGAGGMGEVYRARDTRLDREVALKVLPEGFAQDRERLARFDREAKLLASLNHPGIAAIYDLQQEGGTGYLVMELVPGETLMDLLRRRPVPLNDALDLARQIAEALGAAHEKGVIHRDLKPGNIQITPEEKVKVLDFGLAKALEDPGALSSASGESPTLTHQATQAGVLLGTAAYMSPEQARGKPADRRADVWSFGCVLFELLTGGKTFEGETITDTLASVLKGEPNWDLLPATTPGSIRKVLQRCLQKDPRKRLHDIADARIEIEEVLGEMSAPARPALATGDVVPARSSTLPWILAAVFAITAAVAVGLLMFGTVNPPRPTLRAVVPVHEGYKADTFTARGVLSISPDGGRQVYRGTHGGKRRLYLRQLNELESQLLPHTEDAASPFFSPDGQWIGFFTGEKLKKMPVAGGTPVDLADTPNERGGSWGENGTILYAPGAGSGIWEVPADGGSAREINAPDRERGEVSFRWPAWLPGNRAFLYTVKTDDISSFDEAKIAVFDLKTKEQTILVDGGMYGRYVPTGHLVFERGGQLWAVPFNLDSLKLGGTPIAILDNVAFHPAGGLAHYEFAADGTMVYLHGGSTMSGNSLVWVDRKGQVENVTTKTGHYFQDGMLSPDGERIAVTIAAANDKIWVYELSRGTLSRLTFGGGNEFRPIWTPDGQRLVFSSDRVAGRQLFWSSADRGASMEMLHSNDSIKNAGVWSPDGKVLVFAQLDSKTGWDLWTLPVDEQSEAEVILNTPADEQAPAFSPDGRFLAYHSDESGRNEVYVQPFPGPGRKWQISIEGGENAVWSPDGSELFYLDGERINMMVVSIRMAPALRPGTPRKLFGADFLADGIRYDISSDGERFLFIKDDDDYDQPSQMTLVVNWFEELKRLMPAGTAP